MSIVTIGISLFINKFDFLKIVNVSCSACKPKITVNNNPPIDKNFSKFNSFLVFLCISPTNVSALAVENASAFPLYYFRNYLRFLIAEFTVIKNATKLSFRKITENQFNYSIEL